MFHFRDVVNDWPSAVVALPEKCSIKAVDRGDILRSSGSYKNGIFTVLRHWNDNYAWTNDWETAKQLARDWFDSFIDGTFISQYVQHVMAVSERNEYDSHVLPPQERATRILWMQAAAWVWTNEYRNQLQQFRPGLPPIYLILADNAVGNDLPVEAAQLAVDNDLILGYHPYIAVYSPSLVKMPIYIGPDFRNAGAYRVVNKNGFAPVVDANKVLVVPGERSPDEWRWLSGRWHFMEQEWGLKPKWAFTEAGPVQDMTGAYVLNPNGGWRTIWGYSQSAIDSYIDMLEQWLSDVQRTPAYAEGRIYGFNLFNTGGAGWDGFKTEQPEMGQISVMLQREWKPGTVVEQDRVNGLDVSRYQGNIHWPTARSRGARFVFAKATEHTSWVDPMFSQYVVGAKAADIIVGAYHFYRPNYDPIAQANHFVSTVAGRAEMPLVVDVEIAPGLTFGQAINSVLEFDDGCGYMGISGMLSAKDVLELVPREAALYFAEEVRQCLLHIESLTGKRPILYTSPGFYSSYLDAGDLDEVADLWIAHWTTASNPSIPRDYSVWHFWQWTSSGSGPEWGASSVSIDLDRFNGDYQALLDYVNSSTTVPTTPRVVVAHLLPPVTTRVERVGVNNVAYQKRQTVAYSADDVADLALVGLPGSYVIVYAPDRWQDDIIEWLHDRGVEKVEVGQFPIY